MQISTQLPASWNFQQLPSLKVQLLLRTFPLSKAKRQHEQSPKPASVFTDQPGETSTSGNDELCAAVYAEVNNEQPSERRAGS